MIILALTAALLSADHHGAGENAHAEGMPWCDMLEADRPHTDCALQTSASRDLLVNIDFSDMEDGREMIDVSVTQFDGTLVQTMHFASESFFYPRLVDLTGDGLEELLVPIETGNVNTIHVIAMGALDGFELMSDEINGHTVEPVDGGYFAAHARDNAVTHYVDFYAYEDGILNNHATVRIAYESETEASCTLVAGGEYSGEDYFCGLAIGE